MLIYFQVSNYKSIKDPLVINFSPASLGELSVTNIIKGKKRELLKAIVLTGANASGKSKILDALVFFRNFILDSATDKKSTAKIDTEAFELNIATGAEPSSFEAEFVLDEKIYRYGFQANEERIHREWLLEVKTVTVKPIFMRIGQEFQVDEKKFPLSSGLDHRTRKNALYLSVAAQWNVALAEKINAWFDSIYTVNGMEDDKFKALTTTMIQDPKYSDAINGLIKEADLGIKRIQIFDITDDLISEQLKQAPMELHDELINKLKTKINTVYTIHDVFDADGNIVSETIFPINHKESEGTRKFYNLAGMLTDAIDKGKLVIFDEMDARLHSLLSRAIMHMFNSVGNDKGAQLLAVTHDSTLLDNDLLRRDQIYFVEKDNVQSTRVSSLAEFKVRKESPYSKNYLEGKYGGIPFIENFELKR